MPSAGSSVCEDSFLRALLENSSDVITILDAGGTILYQSPSVKRILGYEQQELVGTDGFARIHPDDVEHVRTALQGRQPGATGRIRYRFLHADGSWRLLEAAGRSRLDDPAVRGIVVNSHDVTERQETEEALQRSERYFRSLFENAADVVTIVDADGTIRYESPSATRTVGWSTEEMVGRNLFEFVHPEDAASTMETFQGILSRPGEVCAYELRFRHRDGSWRVLDGLGRNLLDDPAVRGIVANSRDVTDKKLAEEELIRARDASEAANRAKSDFLSGMSHELRTPLNSVIGFTSVLLRNRGANLREQELGYLGRILANGKHLLGLINDVLDLSKIEAGKMEVERAPVAVDALVLETAAELRGTLTPGVELRVSVPPGAGPVDTDRGKLKQVLINLVGNAIKFTERGTVDVVLAVDPATRRPLRIDVADTGVGIPAERLQAIFRPFEQVESGTARRYGGTGLGLAICRSLCTLMDYGLEVESVPGAGSTFRIVLAPGEGAALPKDGEALHPLVAEPPEPARAGGSLAGKLVLVIDDEIDSRTLLAHHLEELGCQTIAASTGEQGMRMAREFRPDLITLDLLIPGTSGWEILRALKADPGLCDIPVVVVSVIAGENRGKVMGAVDLLEKPVEREELLAVLRRHLGDAGAGRALVVGRSAEVRGLLSGHLEDAGVEVRSAHDGREASAALETFAPDLVVVDLAGLEEEGMGALQALHGNPRSRAVPLVIVTSRTLARDQVEALSRRATAVLRSGAGLEEELREVVQRIWLRAQPGG